MSYRDLEKIRASAAIEKAEIGAGAQLGTAEIGAETDRYKSDRTLEGVGLTADASEYGSRKQLEGTKYTADRTLEAARTPRISYGYSMNENLSRARGGPVKGRLPYLVGEKGPELMVPEQSGYIIPNHKLQELVRAIPRARGGPVFPGGGVPEFQAFTAGRSAAHLEDKKNLMAAATNEKVKEMEAAARIDPTGSKGYHQAASLQPLRAEDEAKKGDYAREFTDFWKTSTGAAAAPKPEEPDYPDYYAGLAVAKRYGPKAAEAFHADTQKIKQIRPLFTPENVAKYHGISLERADGFIRELQQNPADYRRYLLAHGPAIQKIAPPPSRYQEEPSFAVQTKRLTDAITPNWMVPVKGKNY